MMSPHQEFNPYAATEPPLAEPLAATQSWKEIARRWEKRRIWFNVVLLALGVPLLILARGMNAVVFVPHVFVFGIAANICYTFGPLAEMYANWLADEFEDRIPAPIGSFIRSTSFFTTAYYGGLLLSVMLVLVLGLATAFDSAIPNQQ